MSAAATLPGASNRRERTMITPEGLAIPIVVGSRGARIGALILDFTFLYIGLLLFVMLMVWIAGGILDETLEVMEANVQGAQEFIVIVFILVLFLARYGYFLMFELGPRGATPGKRITGLRVAARNGGRLTADAVIARNLLRDIEIFLPLVFISGAPSGEGGAAGIAATLWFAIFMLFPFFNRDALRAGDVIAGTWVVEAPRTKLAEALSTSGGARGESGLTGARYEFGERELSVYGEHELQTLERVLRGDNPDALSSVHQAICRKIGWDPGAGDERAFLEAFYAQLRARLENDMRFGKRKLNKFDTGQQT